MQVPRTPKNGFVRGHRYLYHDNVTFACNIGFRSNGSVNSTCTENGTWSSEPPACDPVFCPTPPPAAVNAFLHGTNTSYGARVNYTCIEGYEPTTPAVLVCGSGGHWNGTAPGCTKVTCPTPEPLENGRVVGKERRYGDTIEYTCSAGFRLTGGDKKRSCLGTAAWSGGAPVCKEIRCASPVPVDNADCELLSDKPGAVVKYRCRKGYEISGKDTRTCKFDGTWTGPTPKCHSINCQLPTAKTNAHGRYQDGASTTYGSKIQFVCDQGYQLESGDKERTCTEGKSWTGSEPTCGAISCPAPDAISYGVFKATSYKVDSTVKYNCVTGFQLIGEATRTCLANKTWTGAAPQCRRVECAKPSEIISNGRMISSNFSFAATIHYSCDSGYFMDSDTTSRTCTASGMWDGPIPTCNRVKCPPPPRPANCHIEGYDFRFKEHITYICKNGFELIGELRRTCQANKRWSGYEPRCVTIQVRLNFSIGAGFEPFS